VAGSARRLVVPRDNHRLFPDICAKNGKWFRRAGELFRQPRQTKQWPEKFNKFSHDAVIREDQAEHGKLAVGAAPGFFHGRGRPRSPADRMNRSLSPADSVERRATSRTLVR
jgi:hypothetical protein